MQVDRDCLIHQVEKLLKPLELFVVALDAELVFFLEEVSLVHVVIVAQSDVHFAGLPENVGLEERQLYR